MAPGWQSVTHLLDPIFLRLRSGCLSTGFLCICFEARALGPWYYPNSSWGICVNIKEVRAYDIC